MSTVTESIGRVLAGRYRVESVLGTGASAHVFAAWDVTLRRRVAIKLLHPALAADSAFLRRFRGEARAAAALTHPNILAVYDWGEDPQGPFLVLEFLGGGSLRDMLDAGRRLSVSQAVSVGAQAAEALSYAHGRGFVHRDVKPANLLFDEEGRLRIADFGLARALAEAAMTEPAGATVGTARYAAPEQALGDRVDGRADVYALSLVLYEAVTGRVPFSADTTITTLMARVGAELPSDDALGPLEAVLRRSAAPDVARRLDATSLAAELATLGSAMHSPPPLVLAGATAPAGSSRAPDDPPGTTDDLDRTEHGISAPPGSGERAGPSGSRAEADHEASSLMAVASAVGVATEAPGEPPTVAGPGEPGRSPLRVRLRSRSAKTTLVVLVVVLVVGGAAFGVSESGVLLPSHRLPDLSGLSAAGATSKLSGVHMQLAVSARRYSTSVPAGDVVSQVPPARKSVKQGTTVQVVLSKGPPPVTVPSLSSVTTGDCPAVNAVLARANLHATCTYRNSMQIAKGGVLSWSPRSRAPEFSAVKVVVSAGPPIVNVPSLSGLTCTTATSTLAAAGLGVDCVNTYTTTGTQVGEVIPADWSPSATAPQGSTVTVRISQGPPPVQVPVVASGATLGEEESALQSVGLKPGQLYGPLTGTVFATNPGYPATVPQGSTVDIYTR